MAPAVLADYFWWHYRFGIAEFVRGWMNFHRFLLNFFSVPILLKSFFAPFHRIQEKRHSGFDPQDFAETIIINFLMRIVGAMVRATFIIIALIAQGMAFAAGCFFLTVALALPLVVIGGFFLGISFITKSLL